MKSTSWVMICVIASLPGIVNAGDGVDETRSVSANSIVRIHCTRGELSIVGWDREEVHIEGELDDLASRLLFEVNGEETLIRVQMPDSDINRGDGSDLTISVPATVRLKLEAVSTDVAVRGMTGELAIRTVSGDVDAERVGAFTYVKTTSGDVNISEGSGMVKVVTTSGDTTLELDASEVSVDSVSGDMELVLEAFDSIMANAVSGELEIEGTMNPDGRIESSTVSGDIDLRLEEPVNANLDIRTGPGGEIDNELTDEEPTKLFPSGMELQTTIGDASGGIRVATVTGEIRLDSR